MVRVVSAMMAGLAALARRAHGSSASIESCSSNENVVSVTYKGSWKEDTVSFFTATGEFVDSGPLEALCLDSCVTAAVTYTDADVLGLTANAEYFEDTELTKVLITASETTQLYTLCLQGGTVGVTVGDITANDVAAASALDTEEQRLLQALERGDKAASLDLFLYSSYSYSYPFSYSYSYSFSYSMVYSYFESYSYSMFTTTDAPTAAYDIELTNAPTSVPTSVPIPVPTTVPTAVPTFVPTTAPTKTITYLYVKLESFFSDMSFRGDNFYSAYTELNNDSIELAQAALSLATSVLGKLTEEQRSNLGFDIRPRDIRYAMFLPTNTRRRLTGTKPSVRVTKVSAEEHDLNERRAKRRLLQSIDDLGFNLPDGFADGLVPDDDEIEDASGGDDLDFDQDPGDTATGFVLDIVQEVDEDIDETAISDTIDTAITEAYEDCSIYTQYESAIESSGQTADGSCDTVTGAGLELQVFVNNPDVLFVYPTQAPTTQAPTPRPNSGPTGGATEEEVIDIDGLAEQVCDLENLKYGHKLEQYLCRVKQF